MDILTTKGYTLYLNEREFRVLRELIHSINHATYPEFDDEDHRIAQGMLTAVVAVD